MPETVFFSLYRMLAAMWRRRYLIITPVLLMPVLGTLVGTFSSRQWETHTTILIQETAKLNPFLEDLSVSTNLEGRMAALDTLLHSRHVLLAVAEDLGKIGSDSSDLERDQMVGELSRALQVKLVGSDLVKLSYKSNKQARIAETLSAVRGRFLDNLLAPELSSIHASEEFLQNQLQERRDSLRQAEQSLAEYKRQHASDLPDLHGANVSRLRQLKDDLVQRRTMLAGARAALDAIRTRLIQVDPVIGRLEEKIISITSELALLRARYTDNHSKVQAAVRKLRRLEIERSAQIQNSAALAANADLDRLWQRVDGMTEEQTESGRGAFLIAQLQELQSAEGSVKRLEEEVASISEQVSELDQRVAGFGDIERTMAELERDLDVKRNLYTDLLQRFEKARVTGALGLFEQPERVKVIDEPFTPSRPVNLPVFFFFIGGVVGGFVLGLGMALLSELADTTIRRRDQLTELLDVPVFSRIPCFQSSDSNC